MEIPEYSSLLHYLSLNPKTLAEEEAEKNVKPSPDSLLEEGEVLVEATMESSAISNVEERIFIRCTSLFVKRSLDSIFSLSLYG